MNELSDFLKDLRENKTKSLRRAAREIGISHTYLDSLEKGYDPRTKKERKPTPDVLRKISNYYDVPYSVLMQKAGYADEKGNVPLDSFFDMVPPSMGEKAKKEGGTVAYGSSGWQYAEEENEFKKVLDEYNPELEQMENDLYSLLTGFVGDIYYKNHRLTDKEIQKIKTAIQKILEGGE